MGLLKSGEKLEDTLLIQIPEELEAKGHLKLEIRDQDSSFPGLIYNWSLDRPLPSHDLQGPLMQSFTLLRDKNPSMQHKFMLKGKILDQMGLKDMQVFVNGQKIEYRLFNQESQRHKVEVSIPLTLEKSRNRIEIHARDSDGILSQRILNWWKWVEKEAVSFNGNS